MIKWAAQAEKEEHTSDLQEWTPAEMVLKRGQRAFLHVGLLSLQRSSNSQ